jgi:hypothetical protein
MADPDTTNTSLSPAPSTMAAPNTTACTEAVSMDLANPAPTVSANGTGGVPAASPPFGC